MDDPETRAEDAEVLDNLIYGWGNESYSALEEFLRACITQSRIANGPVLECGSGLSTLILGALADCRGSQHWVLEHDPVWAGKLRQTLDQYAIRSVRICVGPLLDYGDYAWYGTVPDDLPAELALVICDGPPGDTPGGRYGLLPRMGNRLRAGSVILLDDVSRQGELAVAQQWRDELGIPFTMEGYSKPYCRFVIT